MPVAFAQADDPEPFHHTAQPPSTQIFCPVMYAPAFEHSSAAAPFRTGGCPIRVSGFFAASRAMKSGFSFCVLSNGNGPGLMQLARMPCGARKLARYLVSWMMPALAAP